MKVSRVGVGLARNVFQIHGTDAYYIPVWTLAVSERRLPLSPILVHLLYTSAAGRVRLRADLSTSRVI